MQFVMKTSERAKNLISQSFAPSQNILDSMFQIVRARPRGKPEV